MSIPKQRVNENWLHEAGKRRMKVNRKFGLMRMDSGWLGLTGESEFDRRHLILKILKFNHI